jgi:hypothetical protein
MTHAISSITRSCRAIRTTIDPVASIEPSVLGVRLLNDQRNRCAARRISRPRVDSPLLYKIRQYGIAQSKSHKLSAWLLGAPSASTRVACRRMEKREIGQTCLQR